MKQVQKNIIAVLIVLAGLFILWRIWPKGDEGKTELTEEQRVQKEVFFRYGVPEAQKKFIAENEEAIARLEERIDQKFQEWRSGIPSFVDDITDFGSKTKLTRYTLSDFIEKMRNNDEEAVKVATYVRNHFEHHLFDEVELKEGIDELAESFQKDVSANRKKYYATLKQEWDSYPFENAEFPMDELMASSMEEMTVQLQDRVELMVGKSVGSFVASELITTASGYLVTQIIIQVSARTTAGVASAATVGGGTAAASTLGGGTVGTGVSPGLGTAIGAGVGLAVGAVVDVIMTKDIQKKLTHDLESLLLDIQNAVINGDENNQGLISFYSELSAQMASEDFQSVMKLEGK